MGPISRSDLGGVSVDLEGGLARFYEIGTDKPLYFTKQYELVYRDDDLPTHYGFIVSSKLDSIEREYKKLKERGASKTWRLPRPKAPKLNDSLLKSTQQLIEQLDDRGAWVEKGTLQNFPQSEQSGRIISTRTYLNNLSHLADFIAASQED